MRRESPRCASNTYYGEKVSANKTPKTLADYVAIAISPVLIMALVGSLVFFLVAVLYVGEYASRLRWILFFFVFGAILISRMTMQGETADRAGIYGFVLGLLVWVALILYVDWGNSGVLAPFGWLLDIGLIAVVWWSAHRLTWDCTLIDDNVDASGAGLLQVAGLEGKTAPAPDEGGHDAIPSGSDRTETKLTGLVGWWERYRRYREERRKRPHTPGVWVVYFSLAALPLFGIGQALLSANPARSEEDLAKLRGYAFWLMTIYVGSGLGLLLTTCFLGLRRYLRQRKLQMPVAMTGVWLTVGGMLIAAFLLVGALLPRPESAQRLAEWAASLTSPKREASEHDQLGDEGGAGKGKGQGRQSKDQPRDKDGANRDKIGNAKDQKGEKDGNAPGKDGKGGDKSEKDGKGTKDGKANDKGAGGSGQKDSRGDKARDGANKQKGTPKDGKDKSTAKDEKPKDGVIKDKKDRNEKDGSRSEKSSRAPPERSPTKPPIDFKPLANILKWIVIAIVAVVVLFVLLRNGLRFLANFTAWARRLLASLRAFWQGLLGWFGGRSRSATDDEEEQDEQAAPRPFADFRDPFRAGTADRMSNERLVRYCFDALQAWAQERDLGRQAGETPLEFARRIGEETPALDMPARKLASFYVQIAYAKGTLGKSCREPLKQFWEILTETVERPMSAGVGGG
jgi:hypothetical protein